MLSGEAPYISLIIFGLKPTIYCTQGYTLTK